MDDKDRIIKELQKKNADLSLENQRLKNAHAETRAPFACGGFNENESVMAENAKTLEKHENTLRFMNKLIETASVMIVGTDRSGNAMIFNNEAEKVSGYSREEILGKNWLEKILPREMLGDLWENISELIICDEIANSYENVFVTKSGEKKIILWQNTTLIDNNSQITHMFFGIDITDKKITEENLRLESKMLDSIADNVFLVDDSGNIKFTNKTITRTHGYSKEELEKMNIGDIIDENDIKEKIREMKVVIDESIEVTHIRSDKTLFPAEMHASKIYYNGKKYFLFVNRDLTERKKIETRLKELNATKDKLFSIIGHDLRGPIGNAIDLFALINDEKVGFTQEQKDDFFKMHSNALKNIRNLLDNLLQWAKSQKNEIHIDFKRVNIKKNVIECFELLKGSAGLKKIELLYNIDGDPDVLADEKMIQTVIRNLVSNSIKYCFENGRIEVSAFENGENVQVAVSDNGIGMDSETIERLFKITGKSSVKGTRGESGTGLGLLLCAEFISKNNGKIWAESEPGKGSVFIVRLPRYFSSE